MATLATIDKRLCGVVVLDAWMWPCLDETFSGAFPCPILSLTSELWPTTKAQEPFRERITRDGPRGSCRYVIKGSSHQSFTQTRFVILPAQASPLTLTMIGGSLHIKLFCR